MLDMPSKSIDLRLHFIKDDVGLLIIPIIDQDSKSTVQFIDALNVVS